MRYAQVNTGQLGFERVLPKVGPIEVRPFGERQSSPAAQEASGFSRTAFLENLQLFSLYCRPAENVTIS
jgi:hypothetical protein